MLQSLTRLSGQSHVRQGVEEVKESEEVKEGEEVRANNIPNIAAATQ